MTIKATNKFFALAVGLFAFGASAQTLDITSFQRLGDARMQLGEVCGRVTGLPAPTQIKLVIDYDTAYAGTYNTYATDDGAFCQVVRTIFGRVRASTPGVAEVSSTTAAARADAR